jgi:hypothetical protein
MKEYRIMSPPRRPRGEKPQTTIRYLHRQINNLLQELLSWKIAGAERDKKIAAQDVELSEAADREHIFIEQIENAADQYGALLTTYRKSTSRLAYLEGYYDRSQELLPHDPAKINRGSGTGNTGDLPNGAQAAEEEGAQTFTSRASVRPREEIRRGGSDDTAYSDR